MSKVVILTGAGISAESGINTFRDSDGLWNNVDVKELATKEALKKNRDNVIEFYNHRRAEIANKEPNVAHKKLVELVNNNDDIKLITQNVDDLFEKAGADNVIHLHGKITEVKCQNCGLTYDIGYKKQQDAFNGKCPVCFSKKIRPNIVMFGEPTPEYKYLYEDLKDCKVFVVIGTSGNVIDVDILADGIEHSLLNNLATSPAIDESKFEVVIHKPATEAIDEVIEFIKENI